MRIKFRFSFVQVPLARTALMSNIGQVPSLVCVVGVCYQQLPGNAKRQSRKQMDEGAPMFAAILPII